MDCASSMLSGRETIAIARHADPRRGTRCPGRDAFSVVRRGPTLVSSGAGCRGPRRQSVQAVGTSPSRTKGSGRQTFVEPLWLLPSIPGDTQRTGSNLDAPNASTSGRRWSSNSQQEVGALYYIVINTSKDDGSGLSEPNSGILLSMIGENGKAILHKVLNAGDESSNLQIGGVKSSLFRFQQGAVDVLTVIGPDLGRLAALWIAPEAGTWRLEKASVTLLPWAEHLCGKDGLSGGSKLSLSFISEKSKELELDGQWKAIFHLFETREALLGDKAWLSAAQLKPSIVQDTPDATELEEKVYKSSPKLSRSLQGIARQREESMKEYENLKISLLGFSSLLVASGTATFVALGQGKLAEGFAIGGAGGFLYLFLLERAVDHLPASSPADASTSWMDPRDGNKTSVSTEESNSEETGDGVSTAKLGKSSANVETSRPRSLLSGAGDIGIRGRVALILGVTLLVGRSAGGGAVGVISPPELLAGVLGFLTSKLAVVLAALRPTSQPGDNR